LQLLGNAGGSEAGVTKLVVDDQVPPLVLQPNGVRSCLNRFFQNTDKFQKRLVRVVGVFWHGFLHHGYSSSSSYCGGLLPSRFVTLGNLPAGTLSSMASTLIWCHQSSPKSNQ